MADSVTEFAKLLKERDNPKPMELRIGKVVSISPLRIRLSDKEVLQERHVYLGSSLNERGLLTGDNVACIPFSNGQQFFIADKVVNG